MEENRTQQIIKELQSLRGTEVLQFGQPIHLPKEPNKYEVDTIDLIKSLEEYEVDPYEKYGIDPSETDDGFDWQKDWNLMEVLATHEIIPFDYESCGNSYNWNANVSNHFDWRSWKLSNGDGYLVALQIQRGYGDVRGNYTDFIWYEFGHTDEMICTMFEESVKSISHEVFGKIYWCYIDAMSDGIRIADEWGDERYSYEYISNDKEMIAEIKEKFELFTWLERCSQIISKLRKGA